MTRLSQVLEHDTGQSQPFNKVGLVLDRSRATKDPERSATISSNISSGIADKLWENRASLKHLTSLYSLNYLERDKKEKLFKQIDLLLDADDWNDDDNLVDIESFKTLVKVILNIKFTVPPLLGVSNRGWVTAHWGSEKGKIVIESFPNDRVRYFAVSGENDGEKRAAGDANNLKDLIDMLYPFKDTGLFKND